jgi:hypothetical protein
MAPLDEASPESISWHKLCGDTDFDAAKERADTIANWTALI